MVAQKLFIYPFLAILAMAGAAKVDSHSDGSLLQQPVQQLQRSAECGEATYPLISENGATIGTVAITNRNNRLRLVYNLDEEEWKFHSINTDVRSADGALSLLNSPENQANKSFTAGVAEKRSLTESYSLNSLNMNTGDGYQLNLDINIIKNGEDEFVRAMISEDGENIIRGNIEECENQRRMIRRVQRW